MAALYQKFKRSHNSSKLDMCIGPDSIDVSLHRTIRNPHIRPTGSIRIRGVRILIMMKLAKMAPSISAVRLGDFTHSALSMDHETTDKLIANNAAASHPSTGREVFRMSINLARNVFACE